MGLDHRCADHLVIEHNRERVANIFRRIIPKLSGTRGVKAETRRWATVLVKAGLRINQFFTGNNRGFFKFEKYTLFIK